MGGSQMQINERHSQRTQGMRSMAEMEERISRIRSPAPILYCATKVKPLQHPQKHMNYDTTRCYSYSDDT